MVNSRVVERTYDPQVAAQLAAEGCSPLLAKVFAARGIVHTTQLESALSALIPPERLTNSASMAVLLADAIAESRNLLVVGDYDSDGATATAVALRALRSMGARVDFLVPNRFEYGYGLTPEIVDLAATRKPDVIITVDNGIASVDGVTRARELGIAVLVTDHHLPGEQTPDAACIVNPNQRGCDFPSKHLAGVGVVFYVMLSLRAELRRRGAFVQQLEPNLTELLDLVALGTVADLVRLDDNNRILVDQGLRRIRAGKGCPGIRALMRQAGRNPATAGSHDLGFSVGPRLNAAGRLDDMSLGIACLLADDEAEANAMAARLNELNLERRSIEAEMHDAALLELEEFDVAERYSISIYQPEWHQGVIGILASRVKEKYHRPVIAFANAGHGVLKGSGRSIPGLHLRDALDLLSKQRPDLLLKFGGHAMAAGLIIREGDMAMFALEFERVVHGLLTPADLEAVLEVDGSLAVAEIGWDMACAIERQVWGQGFPLPMFCDSFSVVDQRIVGERHLKLKLEKKGRLLDAIFFQQQTFLPTEIIAIYQLQTNQFNGAQSVQLNLRQWFSPA